MSHIAANHANNLRKEDNRKYGKAAKRGRLFFSYEGCVALNDDPESIRLSKDIRLMGVTYIPAEVAIQRCSL